MIEGIIGFVGVLVGASITGFNDWLLSARRRKENAQYLAIRVVCQLDWYVECCAEVAGDDGEPGPGGREPSIPGEPSLPAYPDDVDWKSINHSLAYRALSLPNEAKRAARCLDFVLREISAAPEHDEYFKERQFQYSRLGLKAHAITADFRKEYGIPDRNTGDWQPEPFLQKQIDKIEKMHAKRRGEQGT